jgi:hypothetical protein
MTPERWSGEYGWSNVSHSMSSAVVARMSISVARVSQIEAGDVSTQEAPSRYIGALSGLEVA